MKYELQSTPPNSNKKPIIIALSACAAALLLFFVWYFFIKSDTQPAQPVQEQTKDSFVSDIRSVEAKYLFSGTVVPARAVEKNARTANGIDYNQPFSKLSTFKPEQYDGWTVDMECPITSDNLTFEYQVANTVFNCRPEFLPAMGKYFSVMNLANNHVYDRGKDKFPQMQQYINKAGIQYVGNQDPAVSKDVCEVMAMRVNLIKKDGTSEKGALPMAFCAWHYFERSPRPGEFDVMNEYAKIMPVVGLMQAGVEYRPTAGADQQSIGRQIIDGGAEFVIGNSPHWVQNSDVYRGKLIFYSTGNFIFDQLDAETNRGASIEVNMKINYDENIAKWLELGESCKQHYDDCLEKAKQQQLTKYNPELTFGLVASTTGNRQITQKANSTVQAAVEKRANWTQTLKELGQ